MEICVMFVAQGSHMFYSEMHVNYNSQILLLLYRAWFFVFYGHSRVFSRLQYFFHCFTSVYL